MHADSPSPASLLLSRATELLDPLLNEFAFVGGQVVEFLVTSPASTTPRPTFDVDVVVPVTTRAEYAALEESLRDSGLAHDTSESAPICRWITSDKMVLDIMPSEEGVLGFANRWYGDVLSQRVYHTLETGVTVPLPTAPLYLATKWEAYRDRGSADPLRSADLEDIIAVVTGRPEIVQEIQAASPELRRWLSEQATEFLSEGMAEYAIAGTLPDAGLVPGIVEDVIGRFRTISKT